MARTEAVSKMSLKQAEKEAKKKRILTVPQQAEIQRRLDEYIPGEPTGGKVLLDIKQSEIAKESQGMLETNTNIHEVVACYECNDKRIKTGVWIQVQKQAAMEDLQWGSGKKMLAREHQIVWVFDRNPNEFKEKITQEVLDEEEQDENNAEIDLVPEPEGGDKA